ncbi:L,D-transpeptidase [Aquicella lusitana]|uniref:Lipoprotein-anchoring transpeptidase ErfK/SrfK n=1 Tax=Aquicella lusitana TaxID=254246 RepID=A0A370GX00_9COXI|nr:L,D-transpeptidase [Aquicella lusitana]RDI48081.1 lipoprotein-anchoring transpeptidase ErfK/SrfK [Aquicella lusitana]VVC72903.1 hypothetical protein AQULUS_06270 [Aquicella lusitana]
MRGISLSAMLVVMSAFMLSSCSYYSANQASTSRYAASPPKASQPKPNYAARMPQKITPRGEKVVVVDPSVHAWGAYGPDGTLIRGGLATAGSSWCPDIKRPCRTKVGTFRINSLGSAKCKSSKYPLPRGGAPMPYCMFFNGHQGLHGSYNVVDGNESHGCVRMHVEDAEWLRFNFARVGTKVIVWPYN